MTKNILNIYHFSNSFCYKKCSPDIEKKASTPNQNIFNHYIYLFTIFWPECPLIINDTITIPPKKEPAKVA